jgi:hypothetical protein
MMMLSVEDDSTKRQEIASSFNSMDILQRISDDKTELVKVISNISKEFLRAKAIMEEEPDEARYIFEMILVQLTMLRSITFTSKQDEWLTEIERLHRSCTENISLILMRKRVEKQDEPLGNSVATTVTTNIPNWKDPLLLQTFQILLAELVILPYLFPHLYPVLKTIIILNGPSRSGKTFTLKAIESYLHMETNANVLWKNISSFQLSSIATILHTAIQGSTTAHMKIVVVVDRVSTAQWNTWIQEDWFHLLLDTFKSSKSWKLIIVTEASSTITPSQQSSWKTSAQIVNFKLPDMKTVYAYIKSLVNAYLDTRTMTVPILLDLQGLVSCAETMTKIFHADFDMVETWIQRAIHLSHELVIEDAVVLKIGEYWIPRLSLFSEKTLDLPYTVCRGLMLSNNSVTVASLLRPVTTDAIVFDGDTYVNEKLLDYLPPVDPDRGMEIFVKTDDMERSDAERCSFMPSSSSSSLDIICRFSITLDRYPDIPVVMTQGIYSYFLASWVSIWKQLHQASVKSKPTVHHNSDLHSKLAIVEPELQTIFYTRDMNTLLDETIDLLISGSVSFPQSLHQNLKHCSKQVLNISGIDENFAFYFTYGQKSSKALQTGHTIQEGGGGETDGKKQYHQTFGTIVNKGQTGEKMLPVYSSSSSEGGSMKTVTDGGSGSGSAPLKGGMLHGKEKAEEIKLILDDLLGHKDCCQVFQMKTHDGYEWFIDFFVILENPIEIKVVKGKATQAIFLPRLQSTLVFDDLVQDYSMTNEIDLDILQEKFPSMYRECFRDEEDTWKMMKLKDPLHIVPLNSFYTREHKFYLNLLFYLQSYKKDHYADLSLQQQPLLDKLLSYIQNMVDFMLMITSENDESGDWEGIWSVSKNHLNYKNDSDTVVRGTTDISREWLKADMTFWISPSLYTMLFDVCNLTIEKGTEEETDGHQEIDKSVPSKLKSIFTIWKIVQSDREAMKEVHRFYVKSRVSSQIWKESKTTFHLLPSTDLEISNKLKSKNFVLYYSQRLKQSLFHCLFENAQLLGCEESGSGNGNISWYSFGEHKQSHVVKEIRSTIESIKSFENAWYLLSTGSKSLATSQLLFSLYFSSGNDSVESLSLIKQLIGHLLYFPIIHASNKRGQESAIDSIDQGTILSVLKRKIAFLMKLLDPSSSSSSRQSSTSTVSNENMDTKKVLLKEKEGEHSLHVHTSSTLSKNIFPQDEYENIKNYSLKVYHLMDQLYCHTGNEVVV